MVAPVRWINVEHVQSGPGAGAWNVLGYQVWARLGIARRLAAPGRLAAVGVLTVARVLTVAGGLAAARGLRTTRRSTKVNDTLAALQVGSCVQGAIGHVVARHREHGHRVRVNAVDIHLRVIIVVATGKVNETRDGILDSTDPFLARILSLD